MSYGNNTTAPTNLKHKPIYAINNYSKIDGNYKNDTDVVALSIGKAQWNESITIPSVKVWRKVNNRWSRQSEETTVTRALDLATLIVSVLDKHYNGKPFLKNTSVFGCVEITDMHADTSVIKDFNDELDINKNDIEEHIKLLKTAINRYYE